MKTKLRLAKGSSIFVSLLLVLCTNVVLSQNLMQNPTCDDHGTSPGSMGSTTDNADAYDMTPNNDIKDELGNDIPSPYQAVWDNDALEDWLEIFYLGSAGSLDEQPGSTSSGNNGTRGVKLYDDGNPDLMGGSSRRLYQKVEGLTIGLDYTFSVESRSEAMGTPSEVYLLNTEITDELGINANGGSDSSVDGFMMITNDFDAWTSNSVTFTATNTFVVLYVRSLSSIDGSTEVFYDNFSLVEESAAITPPTVGQVIGEFPEMDGGMENQTADTTMSTAGSSQSGTASTQWTVSSSSNSSVREMTDDPALARTGDFSAAFAVNLGSNNVRMQSPSPTSPTIQPDTEYTVQYFYSAPTDPADDLDAGIYLNNTSGGVAGNTTDVTPFAADTYTKTYRTVTSGSIFNASNWAVARLDGDDNGYTDTVRIDDFVTYAGPYDDTAPNAPTAGTYANNAGVATIGWTAPSGGVDGGGYVVFKFTTMPNADNDPNQNGIYEYGNVSTNGTGSLTGTVIYIGTETSFTDNYAAGNYYKIYAADKAFNYSDEITVSDATLSTIDQQVNTFKLYPNPASTVLHIESNLDTSDLSVEIYSLLGSKVMTAELGSSGVDVSQLTKGLYLVRVISDHKVMTTRRIIIK
ncbi:MAG: T9SS type A sorting domain-containing protein [Bacteroidota bacterium]